MPSSGFEFDPANAFQPSFDELNDPAVSAIVKEQLQARFASDPRAKMLYEMSDQREYGNLTSPDTRKVKAELQPALEAVGDIWKREEVKNIPVDFMNGNNPGYDGVTFMDGAGRVTGVMVCKSSPHPALTLVHETGHVIDKVFLTNRSAELTAAKAKLLELLKSTDEYKTLKQERDTLEASGKKGKHQKIKLQRFDYLLNDDELIARSYSQFIANQKEGKILEDLKKASMLNSNRFFSSKSEEIKKMYITLLRLADLQ